MNNSNTQTTIDAAYNAFMSALGTPDEHAQYLNFMRVSNNATRSSNERRQVKRRAPKR